MAVSKDTEKGTWTSQIWVEDWQGKKKHKKKRGFTSKKEALEWERNTLLASKADMNMNLTDFVEIYFRDKDGELKQRTIRNKCYMIEHHIIPLLGNKAMDSITPANIIQWQNEIRSKGFKETYQRMLQNQMTALFTHATKIYNLKDNPCTKVKRMGRADADKKQLQFWTLDEFNCFINTFESGSKYHVLFDLLLYSGCRIGEALALTAPDIDTVNKRISITKTYFRHKGYALKGETFGDNALKYLSFSASEQNRFTRVSVKNFGEGYTKEAIRERIEKRVKVQNYSTVRKRVPFPRRSDAKRTLIDTDKEKFQESGALKHWADIQNLKIAAASYAEGASIEELERKIAEKNAVVKASRSAIVDLEHEMKAKAEILKYAKQYMANRKYQRGYEKAKDQDAYFRNHETQIIFFWRC